jgi:hypothetical protein
MLFTDACVDRPSKDNISCAIKALAKWRGIAEMIGKVEDLLKIEDMTKRLEELMASVGVDVNADVKKGWLPVLSLISFYSKSL